MRWSTARSLHVVTLACAILTFILSAVAGCGDQNQSTHGHESRLGETRGAETLETGTFAGRIVSLSPAISQTLVDLELDAHIVGRTPFCVALDRQIAVVGDLHDLNMERLVRLRPTHVLVQPPAMGLDPALRRVAEDRGWRLGVWHLDGIDEIRTMMRELPEVLAGDDEATDETLAERAGTLIERMDTALDPQEQRIFDGRVLLVFGLDPVSAFGGGSYLDDILRAMGGRNAVTQRGYPQLALEDVTRMNPEAIILVRPGGSASQDPRAALGSLGRMNVEAVHRGHLAVLTHEGAFLPSSAVIGVAAELRDILATWADETEPNASTDPPDDAVSQDQNGLLAGLLTSESSTTYDLGGKP